MHPQPGVMEWDQIDWKQCERQVERLQARIVKASQMGRWGKVKVLQRLLTCSFSGKALAVKRVTENKGKRTPGVDHVSLVRTSIRNSTPYESSAAPGISTAALTAGLYSEAQRQVAATRYSDDERPGHAGSALCWRWNHRRNPRGLQLLWFPTRPLHLRRRRTVLQGAVTRRCPGVDT